MERLLAIQDLCCGLDRGTIARSDFGDRCATLIAAQVGCSAAAIWLLFDGSHGRVAEPVDNDAAGVRWGLDLDGPCERFAAMLQADGAVVAHDARQHAATATFFRPASPGSPVRSLLAVPFSLNGDLFGAFVCAGFDRSLRWSPAQLAALRRITVGIIPPLARATSLRMSAHPADLPPIPWSRRHVGTSVFDSDIP